jgi:two-component system chemotaxis sensor kinase CheA
VADTPDFTDTAFEQTAGALAVRDPTSGAHTGVVADRDQLDADRDALVLDPDFAGMFVSDSLEHLGTIEAGVLELESAPTDTELINGVFRPFHTVKGNAGAVGVTSVQQLAHKAENLLELARSGQYTLGATEFDLILESVDLLMAHLEELHLRLCGRRERNLDAARAELMGTLDRLVQLGPADVEMGDVAARARSADPQPTPHGRAAASRAPDADCPTRRIDDDATAVSVKVDTRKLDSLVDMVGELVIAQAIVEHEPSLARGSDERFERNLAHLRRITADLQRTAMSMRMVPIRQTFQKMARLVRDMGKKSGKEVALDLVGEDTELDRQVVADIADPLMHMVRNSMDHGLEDGDTRERAGKPRRGTLTLSAYHRGGEIVIAIADDGAGLRTEKIRAQAVAQRVISASDVLTPAQVHQLIFKAGFSTADEVTDISGRGVGLDVVRGNVEALRGRIDLETTLGSGTTFLITLPLTLAVVEGLLLQVGSERFVVPTFSVSESLRPQPEQIHKTDGQDCLMRLRDRLLPLVTLADLFGVRNAVLDPTRGTVVVIEGDGRQVAVLVDSLIDKQEVVIKSLGAWLSHVRGIAGCAILGDGKVGLILDAHALVRGLGRQGAVIAGVVGTR